jgi:thiol-disulfide isomerase/thioredoxin
MKRILLIVLAVAGVISATYIADRALRLSGKTVSKVDGASGGLLPDVELKDLGGKDLTLSHYRGKVVLLNFWATWCEPCKAEIPELIELQQKYAARGFTVLGVDVDQEGASAVVSFTSKEKFDVNGKQELINYPTVIGNDDAAEKLGGLVGYPTTIVISRDGKQIKRILGPISFNEISQLIESQLQ